MRGVILCCSLMAACGEAGTAALDPGEGPIAPLDIGADFTLSIGGQSPGEDRSHASARFAIGEVPKQLHGPWIRLERDERVTINGHQLELAEADWGPSYTSYDFPRADDGRYVFELVRGGARVTRTVELHPLSIAATPGETLHVADPIAVRWSPSVPAGGSMRVSLSSCVLTDVLELSEQEAIVEAKLSVDPCPSVLSIGWRSEGELGEPFASGTIAITTGSAIDVILTARGTR